MGSKNLREDDDFYFISRQGKEPFIYFEIGYTTFSKMKSSSTKDIVDQFSESVLSKNKAGVRKHIENRCEEEWPKYNFEWKQDAYQSNEIDRKNIYVLINEIPIKKSSIDIIIIRKEK